MFIQKNTIIQQNVCFKNRHLIVLMCLIFTILIYLIKINVTWHANETSNNVLFSTILLGITVLLCIQLIGPINEKERSFFDPGFLFICFVTMGVMPAAILTSLNISITSQNWTILEAAILAKVILAHVVLLLSFTFTYVLFFRSRVIKDEINYYGIWMTKLWIWAALILMLLSFVISSSLGHEGYLLFFLKGITRIATIFAVGVIVSRVSSLTKGRIVLFAIGALFLIVPNLLTADKDVYFLNRGGAFAIALGAACYADRARWNGKLLNWRWLVIGFLVALIGHGGSNILESIYVKGAVPSVETCLRKMVLAFEPRIIENAGVIISWVDHDNMPLQYGNNYIHAVINLIPFEKTNKGLAEWFIWKLNPIHAETGARYAFSAVAEGYLNYRMFGVMIHGIILGIIATLIRHLKYSRRLKIYGLFFYAVSLRITFYLYRTSSFEILKKLEVVFIETAILLFFISILLPIYRFKCKELK